MHAEPTWQEIEVALDDSRIPNKHDLARLLQCYFVAPIEPTQIVRFDHDVRDMLSDPRRRIMLADEFIANGRDYMGQAWKELVSNHRMPPTPTELALWLAVTTKGYPRPRPYCPIELVGSWRQVTPSAAQWRLDAEGTMSTDDPAFGGRTRWCAHRIKPDKQTFAGDELWFTSPQRVIATVLALEEVTGTSIKGFGVGLDGRINYRLERI